MIHTRSAEERGAVMGGEGELAHLACAVVRVEGSIAGLGRSRRQALKRNPTNFNLAAHVRHRRPESHVVHLASILLGL